MWAPPRRVIALPTVRGRHVVRDNRTIFLAHGLLRCARHERMLTYNETPVQKGKVAVVNCSLNDTDLLHQETRRCLGVRVALVEDALCRSFVEQVTLDERDIQALAIVAQQRDLGSVDEIVQLERQAGHHRAAFEAAKQLSLKAPDLASEYLDTMRTAKQALHETEKQIAALHQISKPSLQAWARAQQAYGWAERIWSTFMDWSRPAQVRVIALGLQEGILGNINHSLLRFQLQWQGGNVSRMVITRNGMRRVRWSEEEVEALKGHFYRLSNTGLLAMLSDRSLQGILSYAYDLGLVREQSETLQDIPPFTIKVSTELNDMAHWGFDIGGSGNIILATAS